jgi:hypothetical protein
LLLFLEYGSVTVNVICGVRIGEVFENVCGGVHEIGSASVNGNENENGDVSDVGCEIGFEVACCQAEVPSPMFPNAAYLVEQKEGGINKEVSVDGAKEAYEDAE